jgi:shikimate kinase
MNVVLIGYRGTGKSSVAKHIARELRLEPVSLDAEIVRQRGQSIPEIIAELGWPGFRDIEEQLVRTHAARTGVVLDCGGGVIERPANIEVLRRSGAVVWLSARPETIVARIGGDTSRPSLTGTKSFTDEVEEVLARRTPLYRELAHVEVATDELTPTEVARRALEAIRGLHTNAPR